MLKNGKRNIFASYFSVMNSTKRSYHPLVIFSFYAGLLSDQQLCEIPYTTKKYWMESDHTLLFGFGWVEPFFNEQKDFHQITKRKIIFRSAILCCRILDCFCKLFTQKRGYKSVLKKNTALVIETIDYLLLQMPLEKACWLFQITTNQYYRWKNKLHCTSSVLNLCFRSHPLQLSIKDVTAISRIVNDPENFNKPRSTNYFRSMNTEAIACGRTTFYKYASLTCEKPKKKIPEEVRKKFRANRVFEFLHIDTTFFPTENGKRRVAFVKDNFSKAILHKMILPNGKSDFIRDLLHAAFEKFNLYYHPEPICIVSDDGSENKGEVISWSRSIKSAKVKKVIAQKDFPFTNAMSESIHHLFKTFFAPGKIYSDDAHLQSDLDNFEFFVNEEWFPLELHGLSPMEVLKGETINPHRFKAQIQNAKAQRLIENKNFRCDICK